MFLLLPGPLARCPRGSCQVLAHLASEDDVRACTVAPRPHHQQHGHGCDVTAVAAKGIDDGGSANSSALSAMDGGGARRAVRRSELDRAGGKHGGERGNCFQLPSASQEVRAGTGTGTSIDFGAAMADSMCRP